MTGTVTVAVDANGADLGAAEVAAGAAAAAERGTRVLLFGPAAEIGGTPDGVEVVDAPVSIAKAADPALAVRSTPDASIVRAVKAVAAGEADALVSGGSTGAAIAAGAPSVVDLEFVGNVEGTQVTTGAADVIVTDGFTGNIALKLLEGTSGTVLRAVRDAATSTPRARLGGMLLRPALRRFRDEIDPEGPGGAYMLGLRRVGIVAHGRFTRYGFSQAIAVAERGVREGAVEHTQTLLESAGVLRRAPVSEPAASV